MKQRFETRRFVNYPMEVISAHWDEPVILETTDLSPGGAYINCSCLPEPGEYVVCTFSTDDRHHYEFFGQVVRTNLMRRTDDRGEAGFGVEFMDTKPMERLQIRERLRNSEPPLPVMRKVSKDTQVIVKKSN
ncbi:MAG: PilZ domain-containing protein [Deltaproteobacteria bacterium]|nr:PilZ domain-containing protein [Deltaproteobacteria bacterium]